MDYKSSGRISEDISTVSFGGGGFWGDALFSEKVAGRILDIALEQGVNLIDTGPTYSCDNAEKRIGKIVGNRWRDTLISTKVGTARSQNGRLIKDFSYSGMRSSLSTSLKRLNREQVDFLLLHSPTVKDVLSNEVQDFLLEMKDKNLVRYVGLSSGGITAQEGIESGVYDCVMLTYNILAQEEEKMFALAKKQQMNIFAKSPLAQAFYSPSFFKINSPRRLWYFFRFLKTHRHNIRFTSRIKKALSVDDRSLTEVALKFVLSNEMITSVVIGTSSTENIKINCNVPNQPELTPGQIEIIKELPNFKP